MTHSEDEKQESSFMNLVDHSVISRADPPLARTANEGRWRRWPGILSQKLEYCLDSTTDVRVELAKLTSDRE
jgi:hypothetical protein